MSHPRNFRRKALNMLSFLDEKRFRDKEGKVAVSMASLLYFGIEHFLDVLPQLIGMRAKDDAPRNCAIVCEFRLENNLLVPFRHILVLLNRDSNSGFLLLR